MEAPRPVTCQTNVDIEMSSVGYCGQSATLFWACRFRSGNKIQSIGCWCETHAIPMSKLSSVKIVFEEITKEEYITHELMKS